MHKEKDDGLGRPTDCLNTQYIEIMHDASISVERKPIKQKKPNAKTRFLPPPRKYEEVSLRGLADSGVLATHREKCTEAIWEDDTGREREWTIILLSTQYSTVMLRHNEYPAYCEVIEVEENSFATSDGLKLVSSYLKSKPNCTIIASFPCPEGES